MHSEPSNRLKYKLIFQWMSDCPVIQWKFDILYQEKQNKHKKGLLKISFCSHESSPFMLVFYSATAREIFSLSSLCILRLHTVAEDIWPTALLSNRLRTSNSGELCPTTISDGPLHIFLKGPYGVALWFATWFIPYLVWPTGLVVKHCKKKRRKK